MDKDRVVGSLVYDYDDSLIKIEINMPKDIAKDILTIIKKEMKIDTAQVKSDNL